MFDDDLQMGHAIDKNELSCLLERGTNVLIWVDVVGAITLSRNYLFPPEVSDGKTGSRRSKCSVRRLFIGSSHILSLSLCYCGSDLGASDGA